MEKRGIWVREWKPFSTVLKGVEDGRKGIKRKRQKRIRGGQHTLELPVDVLAVIKGEIL